MFELAETLLSRMQKWASPTVHAVVDWALPRSAESVVTPIDVPRVVVPTGFKLELPPDMTLLQFLDELRPAVVEWQHTVAARTIARAFATKADKLVLQGQRLQCAALLEDCLQNFNEGPLSVDVNFDVVLRLHKLDDFWLGNVWSDAHNAYPLILQNPHVVPFVTGVWKGTETPLRTVDDESRQAVWRRCGDAWEMYVFTYEKSPLPQVIADCIEPPSVRAKNLALADMMNEYYLRQECPTLTLTFDQIRQAEADFKKLIINDPVMTEEFSQRVKHYQHQLPSHLPRMLKQRHRHVALSE